MMAKAQLITYCVDGIATLHQLDSVKEYTLGRHVENSICVHDDSVSRQHASIWFESEKWWISDSNSKNGVFVDAVRVNRKSLGEKHWIRLGQLPIGFSQSPLDELEISQLQQTIQLMQMNGHTQLVSTQENAIRLLEKCLLQVVELLQLKWACVLLWCERRNRFCFLTHTGIEDIHDFPSKLIETDALNRTMSAPYLPESKPYYESINGKEVLVMPLTFENKMLGAIYTGSEKKKLLGAEQVDHLFSLYCQQMCSALIYRNIKQLLSEDF